MHGQAFRNRLKVRLQRFCAMVTSIAATRTSSLCSSGLWRDASSELACGRGLAPGASCSCQPPSSTTARARRSGAERVSRTLNGRKATALADSAEEQPAFAGPLAFAKQSSLRRRTPTDANNRATSRLPQLLLDEGDRCTPLSMDLRGLRALDAQRASARVFEPALCVDVSVRAFPRERLRCLGAEATAAPPLSPSTRGRRLASQTESGWFRFTVARPRRGSVDQLLQVRLPDVSSRGLIV